MNSPIYSIHVTGDSRARGRQHGTLLRQPIEGAIGFYRWLFREYLNLDEGEIRRRASRFLDPTARLNPLLMDELQGIAEGSGQRLEDIVTLSARGEIAFESVALGECSNVFAGPGRTEAGHSLLGQNWDWRPEVMDFRAVIEAECSDMPDYVVVTECGQPGKYGLNEHGLGLAATSLNCRGLTSIGQQLAVSLGRRLLLSQTVDEAAAVFHANPPRATLSFLVADASGRAVDLEATSTETAAHWLQPTDLYWHTNHSLHTSDATGFTDSLKRGERWQALTSEGDPVTPTKLAGWLADASDCEYPIRKTALPEHRESLTWLQTLCSIVMDLNARTLWVADSQTPLRQFSLARKSSAP